MRIEELDAVCRQAAHDLYATQAGAGARSVPPAVVLPLPEATRVTTFPDFPDDDPTRFDLLARFAADVVRPANAPAYGFVGEAVLDGEGGPVDVAVVVYGARGHRPLIMAAPVLADGLGDFTAADDLDPTAMPFLSPLQHAVDAASATGDAAGGGFDLTSG